MYLFVLRLQPCLLANSNPAKHLICKQLNVSRFVGANCVQRFDGCKFAATVSSSGVAMVTEEEAPQATPASECCKIDELKLQKRQKKRLLKRAKKRKIGAKEENASEVTTGNLPIHPSYISLNHNESGRTTREGTPAKSSNRIYYDTCDIHPQW
jgi:hypothetical protein